MEHGDWRLADVVAAGAHGLQFQDEVVSLVNFLTWAKKWKRKMKVVDFCSSYVSIVEMKLNG